MLAHIYTGLLSTSSVSISANALTPASRTLQICVGFEQPSRSLNYRIKQPYPFGRLDQLDFKVQFDFPDSDTDSVASYSFEADDGLQVFGDSRSGNSMMVWVAMAEGAVVADYQLLNIYCHMSGSTAPPRKLSPYITLQIQPF